MSSSGVGRSRRSQPGRGLLLGFGLLGFAALAALVLWVLFYDPGLPEPVPGRNDSRSAGAGRDESDGPMTGTGSGPETTRLEERDRIPRDDIDGATGRALVSDAAREEPGEAEVEGTGSISGRVTLEGSGDPAVGAVVFARPDDGQSIFVSVTRPGKRLEAEVGEDAVYEITGLGPGQFSIAVNTGASDCVALDYEFWKAVELKEDQQLTDIDFTVKRGGRIHGVVRVRDGDPVAGAKIRALPKETEFGFGSNLSLLLNLDRRIETDENGYYEVRGVPFGEKMVVSVSSKEHADARSEAFEILEGQPEVEVNVLLERGSSIVGVARHANGKPAPGTRVHATPRRKSAREQEEEGDEGDDEGFLTLGQRMKNAKADDEGAFEIKNLVAGTYALRGGAANPFDMFGSNDDESLEVEVDGVTDVTGIVLTVPDPEDVDRSGAIIGIVVDHEGNPLADVRVKASTARGGFQAFAPRSKDATAKSDEKGAFTIEKLRPGTYHLTATLDGYSEERLRDVETDGTDARITLKRLGTIRGFVSTGDSGLPSSFKVKAESLDRDESSAAERAQNLFRPDRKKSEWTSGKSDGTFVLEGVPTGRVQVIAEAAGFAPGRSIELSVLPAQELDGVEVPLDSGITMRGRVVLTSGEPVFGARVKYRLVNRDEKPDPLTRFMPEMFTAGLGSKSLTDKSGNYEIRHMAPGRYALSASHPQHAPTAEVVVFAGDGDVRVPDLVLSRGGTIDGLVVRDGAPRSGMMIQCYGEGPLKMATTDEEGKFLFEHLNPGEYRLHCFDTNGMRSGGGMAMKTRPVTIVGEDLIRVKFELGVGHRLFGKVEGLTEGETAMLTIRRPGGPAPEDYDPSDVDAAMEAARFQAGMAFVGADGAFSITDLEAGRYIVEIPVMPSNPADLEEYSRMDRTPRYRREVEVKDKDVELNIRLVTR